MTKDISNTTGTTLDATRNYWESVSNSGPVDAGSPENSSNTDAGPGGALGKSSREYFTANQPSILPNQFKLAQNYPNPFNPSTVITFHLPEQSQVDLVIYDVLGRTVRSLAVNTFYQTGTHELTWDGAGDSGNVLASGVYFYEVQATPITSDNIYRETRKLVFVQ